ncbi:hypothetical protein MATL_G00017970 [Megalops atlanticus]|uniref:Uncharacterized protein n=1 Tax=Megalops atlanticus TaxID=7932 RepID=A0A9D3QHD4_MEGAT|nr:hypothetical protein MATL_G00017970 [Megalops atlanticus]
MKRETLLALGMVFLLCVAVLSTEAHRPKTRLKCCTRKEVKRLRELQKYKPQKVYHVCKRCKKQRDPAPRPGIPLPSQ